MKFISERYSYSSGEYYKNVKYSFSSARMYVRTTAINIGKALLLTCGLFYLEMGSNKLWYAHLDGLPSWVIRLHLNIPRPIYPEDEDSVVNLVSVIASVSGVILALFYPVLATIASTAYSKVHASIRNLLLQEKETQTYLRKLTFLTASSIIVLLIMGVNYRPGLLVLSFLTYNSLVVLFGILRIGIGVYNFFEPSTLAGIVFEKCTLTIKLVTTKGAHWNKASFQNHHYKIAVEQLENLSNISALCLKEESFQKVSFKAILRTSSTLLIFYLHQKRRIPIDSLWFPNMYRHKSYFESDMNSRDLSKNTFTFVQPQVLKNHFWLEDKIVENINTGLLSMSENGHIDAVSQTIYMCYDIFDSLTTVGDLRTGENILLSMSKSSKQIIQGSQRSSTNQQYDEWKYEMGAVESYQYAILRLAIGFFDRLQNFNSTMLLNEINKINWRNKESIYSTNFFHEMYDIINDLYEKLTNEIQVEKEIITPNWYIIQFLTAQHLRITNQKISQVIKILETFGLDVSTLCKNENNYLLSNYCALIFLECIHKLQYRFDKVTESFNDIDKLETCKGEFNWEKPDLKTISDQLSKLSQDGIAIICENLEDLSEIRWSKEYPDVFAQSYSLISTELTKVLSETDAVKYVSLFEPFLKSSLKAFGNLNQLFSHHLRPYQISNQTLMEVMEISGYSYLYSVFHRNFDLWDATITIWNKVFGASEDNIKLLVSHFAVYQRSVAMQINYNEKHRRRLAWQTKLAEAGISKSSITSPMIREFAEDDYSIYSVCEIFIELYLFTFLTSKPAHSLIKRELFTYILTDD